MRSTLLKNWQIITILIFAAIFRFYQLGSTPQSLNLDEVAIGYNAYSILQTGRDEYGIRFPIAFRSHDDYKAPLYIYLTSLPIAVFGLDPFAVRFWSAFLGTLSVLMAYLLTLEIVREKPSYHKLPFLGAVLLTISPRHLQFSRAAFEANTASFFVISGIWAYLKGLKDPRYWMVTTVCFALSLYAYHSTKLFIPLITLVLIYHGRNVITSHYKTATVATIFFIALVLPLIPFSLSPQGQLRFQGTSVFNSSPEYIRQNENQRLDIWRAGKEYQAKLFHHPVLPTSQVVLKGYFSHFTYESLFHGEGGPPIKHTPNVGLLYLWELPFFLIGLYVLFRDKLPYRTIILSWILLVPIASALTWDVPSSTRTTIIHPTLHLLVGLGLLSTVNHLTGIPKRLYLIVITITVGFFFSHYLHNYYLLSDKTFPDSWQQGYREAVLYAESHKNSVDKIVVSTSLRQPQNFFAFYSAYDPNQYISIDGGTVSGGFDESRNHFGKYEFHPISWNKQDIESNVLYIDLSKNIPLEFSAEHTIFDPLGNPKIGVYRKD